MTAKQITVVSARKPINMSCSKNENSAKLMTADIKTAPLGLTIQILSSPVQSEIVQNSEISKLTMSVATKTSKTPQNYTSIPV